MIYVIHMAKSVSVTYIRVTRKSNKIPILNSNNTVMYLTQVNEGNSISFIYTIGFYCCFGIHSVISLRLPIGGFRNSQNDVILAHAHIGGRQRIGQPH